MRDDGGMTRRGRPRVLTDAAIVDAGVRLTLPEVTVRAVASELGVSEMSVYRRTGGVEALRALIAEGIVARADFSIPDRDDPEEALVELALRLRDFVRAHPGIDEHLADLGPESTGTLERIDGSQAEFATRHSLSASQASVLLSTVAEHAVALAAADLRSHREDRDPESLGEATPTLRAGASAAAGLSPEERFTWSIRAVARGASSLLGLPIRTDSPGIPR